MPKEKIETADAANAQILQIQEDIRTLRKDVSAYLDTQKANGRAGVATMKTAARSNLVDLQNYGRDQWKHVEDEVRAKPRQSILMAAVAGALLGFWASRK